MKNRILSFVLSFCFVFSLCSANVFAAGMSIYPEQSYYEFEENQIGEKFVVDFMLDGNEGYNNSTFRVKYDPNVIRAVPNETSDDDLNGFITYDIYKGASFRLFLNSSIESQLNLIPRRGQADFDGLADGVKTSAEIGIIKLGQLVRGAASVYEVFDNGIFLRMTFEVIGPGETDIELLKAAGSSVFAYGLNSVARDVELLPARVKVNGEIKNNDNADDNIDIADNDDSSTETTTSNKSSSSSSSDNNDDSTSTADSSTETTTTTIEEKTSVSTETTTESSKNSSSNSSSGGESNGKNSSSKDNVSDSKENDSEKESEKITENSVKDDKEKEVSTSGSVFSDIEGYPWAKTAINYLAENKIINGIGAGKFAPAANVKRADFLIMLMNVLGIDFNDASENSFKDVSKAKYYAKAVGAAKALGIANGDDKGNFRPEESISRQDMMVLAYRALNARYDFVSDNENALDKFKDKTSVSEYAIEALNAMVDAEIVNGMGSNIEPKNNTTRAQAAVIIYNISRYIIKYML